MAHESAWAIKFTSGSDGQRIILYDLWNPKKWYISGQIFALSLADLTSLLFT